jgi:hypothetical protein
MERGYQGYSIFQISEENPLISTHNQAKLRQQPSSKK